MSENRMQLHRAAGQIDVEVMPGVVLKAEVSRDPENPQNVSIDLKGSVDSDGGFIDGMFDGVKANIQVTLPAVKFHGLLVEAQNRNLPLQIQDYIIRKLGYKPAVRIRTFEARPTRGLPPPK